MSETTTTSGVRFSINATEALAALDRAYADLRARLEPQSPAPRWAVDPDDPRRIIHADSLPDCGMSLTECLQGMEAGRVPDDDVDDSDDWHVGHASGWNGALDALRSIMTGHNIPVSPTSDNTGENHEEAR